MARPKLTFEQRRECEKLLDVIVESDERLTDFIAEYILLKAERDAALRDVEILIRRANDIP